MKSKELFSRPTNREYGISQSGSFFEIQICSSHIHLELETFDIGLLRDPLWNFDRLFFIFESEIFNRRNNCCWRYSMFFIIGNLDCATSRSDIYGFLHRTRNNSFMRIKNDMTIGIAGCSTNNLYQ